MSYTDAFLRAVSFSLQWEGAEFENDPDDPGGATKWGIDQRSHPDVDIRHLTREGAIAIYHTSYWLPVRGDEFTPNLAMVLFDIAVNNGRSRGIKWMQRGLDVKDDGVIGPITIAAANAANQKELCAYNLDEREVFYRAIARGRMAKFLKGWLNRNESLRRIVT